MAGAIIADATSGWDYKSMVKGAAIGGGVGLGASFVNWSVVGNGIGDAGNWVGNLLQQKPTLFLEFTGTAYDYQTPQQKEITQNEWKKKHNGKGYDDTTPERQVGIGKLTLYGEDGKGIKTKLDEFDAVSGPGGNGLLPDNETGYDFKGPELTDNLKKTPNEKKAYQDETGFGFYMTMVVDKIGSRSGIWIHSVSPQSIPNFPNPNLPGTTNGCIGLNGGHTQVMRFYNLMKDHFSKGNKKITVKVKIAGNANIKIQLGNKKTYKKS